MRGVSAERVGAATLLLGLMCVSAPARAQRDSASALGGEEVTATQADRVPGLPTRERREALYQRAKLDQGVALRRSLLLPGLGNIYADQVFKGMLLMSAAGMSLGVAVGGAVRRDEVFLYSGTGAFVALYGIAAITSRRDVSAYNDNLRRRYRVELIPMRRGAAVSARF